jgi:hypothetical protein
MQAPMFLAPGDAAGSAQPPRLTRTEPTQTAAAPAPAQWSFLTGGRTFQRPLADQRWPVFSASYRFQENGRFLEAYEHLSAGDTIALARGPLELGGDDYGLELAVQGAIFSVFDPNLEQSLIVVDYVGGAYAALRRGRAVGMLRFWHISGHIGDEFLLEEAYGIDTRTPYKFEAIQLLGSYDLAAGVRVYGGPSVLFGVNPSDFGDVILHAGVDWRARSKLLEIARPVAGVDMQMIDGFDFQPDVSLRAGLSFEGSGGGPAFQVLGELYHGRDPNGELFSDRVTFAGLGIFINL